MVVQTAGQARNQTDSLGLLFGADDRPPATSARCCRQPDPSAPMGRAFCCADVGTWEMRSRLDHARFVDMRAK